MMGELAWEGLWLLALVTGDWWHATHTILYHTIPGTRKGRAGKSGNKLGTGTGMDGH